MVLNEKSNNENFVLSGYELVHFCELDKYATQSYCAVHGVDESKNLGDITKVDENALQPFTMICGGSPCQDFSIAGRQEGVKWVCKDCGEEYNPLTVHHSKRDCCPKCGSKNIDKTRSSLLVEWLRIIKANKPVWGIYENVKNIVGKRFKDAFDMFIEELHEYGYNTYWKVLNSKDYGIPQNRERLYLIIILKEFDNGKFEFPEPLDNGIRMNDLLEDEVDEKYYVTSDRATALISELVYNDKLNTILVEEKTGRVMQVGNLFPDTATFKNKTVGRVYSTSGLSPTINTCGGGQREPRIIVNEICKSKTEH